MQREETSLIWKSVLPRSTISDVAAAMMRSRVAALVRVLVLLRSLVVCRVTVSSSVVRAAPLAFFKLLASSDVMFSSSRLIPFAPHFAPRRLMYNDVILPSRFSFLSSFQKNCLRSLNAPRLGYQQV